MGFHGGLGRGGDDKNPARATNRTSEVEIIASHPTDRAISALFMINNIIQKILSRS